MNDDCNGEKCTREVKATSALTGYKFMTGKLFVDEVTYCKAKEYGNLEAVAEYHSMYG